MRGWCLGGLVGVALSAACGLSVLGQKPVGDEVAGDAGEAGLGDAPGDDATTVADALGGGCTADLASDPLNCGECGRSCLGGACANGLCAPQVLAMGLSGPSAIALSPTHVYVGESGSPRISRVPLAGGAIEPLITPSTTPRALAVATNALYWVGGSNLRSLSPIVNGSSNNTSINGGLALLLDGNLLFYATEDNRVASQDTSFSNETEHVTGISQASGLALDATHVYWASPGSGTIGRADRSQDNGATIVPGQSAPSSVALDATFLYWATATAIMKAMKNVWVPTPVATALDRPLSLVLDGASLYWMDGGTGSVKRVAAAGGPPLTLASGPPPSPSILYTQLVAVGTTHVYWISPAGTLNRTPK